MRATGPRFRRADRRSFPSRHGVQRESKWQTQARCCFGQAKLLSTIPIVGTALVRHVRGTQVQSETAVSFSEPSQTFTLLIDNLDNSQSAYALSNSSGSTPATVQFELRDANGVLAGIQFVEIGPGRQLFEFASERFTAAGPGFIGTLRAKSAQPIAAVLLRFDNPDSDVLSTVPVFAEDPSGTLYLPIVADGGSYRTTFVAANPSATNSIVHFEFFDDVGAPLVHAVGGSSRVSIDLTIAPFGVARFMTDGAGPELRTGWARLTSPGGLAAVAILQSVDMDRIVSEAPVPSARPATQLIGYVDSTGFAASGIALLNPNNLPAAVTLRLRRMSGQPQDETAINLPPTALRYDNQKSNVRHPSTGGGFALED